MTYLSTGTASLAHLVREEANQCWEQLKVQAGACTLQLIPAVDAQHKDDRDGQSRWTDATA